MTPTTAQTIAQAFGRQLYTHRRDDNTCDAQENLEGRTYYVEPGTLRFHHSRIVGGGVHLCGAAYRVLEVTALDYDNTRRGYRAVLFDLTGRTIYHPKLEQCHRTKEQAMRAFWAWFETFDPLEYYRARINEEADQLARQIERLNTAAADLAAFQDAEALPA